MCPKAAIIQEVKAVGCVYISVNFAPSGSVGIKSMSVYEIQVSCSAPELADWQGTVRSHGVARQVGTGARVGTTSPHPGHKQVGSEPTQEWAARWGDNQEPLVPREVGSPVALVTVWKT